MFTLTVRHVDDSDPPQFEVARGRDGKTAKPVAVLPPTGYPVHGRPDTDLIRELRWYLETFLDYPFPPATDRAGRVQDALEEWGRKAFDALFGSRQAGGFFDKATRDGYEQLQLQISSDDPRILAWPWEALRDPQAEFLAQTCRIERRLNQIRDPLPISEKLPSDRVNILLVTARPYEADVRYRSISRPLVELVEKRDLPAEVHLLRPPTLAGLREHLRQRPDFYHIVHFDGHGSYGSEVPTGDHRHSLRGPQGRLIFETDEGEEYPVTAETLSALLREHRIPAVVLNACQSGMVDEEAEDAFASVAASLLKAGVRSVVGMAYSLYVSGAQQFLPAFYGRLFEVGSTAEATRAGRQEMYANPDRVCARGRFPLGDWLVPVLYQQDPLDLSFATRAKVERADKEASLPQEARDEENPYGFIGRDGAILKLERAMRQRPAGVLIQGLGGVGKTTLARGFVGWLASTEGLGNGCLWLTFSEVRSAEYVFNRMGEPLMGDQFSAAPLDEKIDALAEVLEEHPFVVVWDNFEVARGIPGTSVEANLGGEDQQLLSGFLKRLRGGRTKVIITSRSDEDWLGIERIRISIGGLVGEEQWDYCESILRDLGLNVDRKDEDLIKLMELLDGHPLAMRAILPKLEKRPAGELAAALQSNLDALDLKDGEVHAKL